MYQKIFFKVIFYLTIICFIILLGCQEEKKNPESPITLKSKIDSVYGDAYEPIFLSFSPYMSDTAFKEEVIRLNNEGKLIENKFIIQSNGISFPFDITKTTTSIKLVYLKKNVYTKSSLESSISENVIQNYNNEIDIFLNTFNSETNYENIEIPSGVNFRNLGFNQKKYQFLKDQNKSVVLGYSIRREIIKSFLERQKYYDSLAKSDKDNAFSGIGRFVDNNENYNGSTTFSIEITLEYFYNADMEKIINEMFESDKKRLEINTIEKQKQVEKQRNLQNNLDEL